MNQVVAVTGVGSPTGQALLKVLNSSGTSTICISSNQSNNKSKSLFADISNPKSALDLFSKAAPDTVVHLGHQPISFYGLDSKQYVASNLSFCSNLVKSAAVAGASRFIFASSSSLYGDKNTSPSSESSEILIHNPYAEMKFKCENELKRASQLYGIETVSLRVFNIFGPGLENSLINKLISPVSNNAINLFGPNNFVRDYIHVSDVASSFMAAIETKTKLPEVLNLGTGIATSNQDLIELLPKRIQKKITIVQSADSFSVADTDLSSRHLTKSIHSLDDFVLSSFES